MNFKQPCLYSPIEPIKARFAFRKKMFATKFLIWFMLAAPIVALISGISNRQMVYPLSWLMMVVTLWICCTIKEISTNVFNFYSLFILSALLFNGGQIYLEVFCLNETGILNDQFNPTILSLTLYLVILSLASFHAGGLLGAGGSRKAIKKRAPHNYSRAVSAQATRIVGYGLLAISAVPILIATINALMIVMDSGYFALFEQKRSAGLAAGVEGVIFNFSRAFMPAMLFLYAGSNEKAIVKMLLTFTFLIYVCVLFFMGSRGYATMLLLSGLWVRHTLIKPLPLKQLLIIGILLLSVIFPTVKHIRNIEGASRNTLRSFTDAYLSIESPAVSAISEMGGTMQTVAYTLQLIPEKRHFAMGSTYACVALSIIPNVFWDLHPAVKYGSLSRWLTMTVAPWTYSHGGGLGYSFIAEAYANFGWIGTPIILGLLGFLSARLATWPSGKDDYARIAVVSVCIATALIWARGDANFVVRPLFYFAYIPYIAFRFIRGRLNRDKKINHNFLRPFSNKSAYKLG
jgi:hypothetical protein